MKKQGSPAPLLHLVPLIGLDEGVLMTLEEPIPQLLLVSLVQLEFQGPVVALLVGVDVPYQGAAQCQGRQSFYAEGTVQPIALGQGRWQTGHDETAEGEAMHLILGIAGVQDGLLIESPGTQVRGAQLRDGRGGDAQFGVAFRRQGTMQRKTQLMAGDTGLDRQGAGPLQQAL